MDNFPTALYMAAEWLSNEGESASLVLGDICEIRSRSHPAASTH